LKQRIHRLTGLGIVLAVASTALVASPSLASVDSSTKGLYGSQDATYDGVFRQSLTILALKAAKQPVPSSARSWLVRQQCADGGYEPFRADTGVACKPGDAATYSGQETNSTAIAAVALTAVGDRARAERAVVWLRATQNPDGGFPFYAGAASDANSTAMAVMALRAVGIDPVRVRVTTKSPVGFLRTVTVGCAGQVSARGGVAYQGGATLTPSDFATGQVLAAMGVPAFQGRPQRASAPRLKCPGSLPTKAAPLTDVIAGFTARRLAANDGALPNAFGEGKDLSSTAWAIIGLSSSGVGGTASTQALSALRTAAKGYVLDSSGSPVAGRVALAALAATSQGANPRRFGGVDLIAQLQSSLR
jgi:hypothetical protein